ncbi:phosphopantothenoylcysteine decarboxylase [Lacibacter sp. MH-610]|uniref:phosphopantothenoylcysteine decarboxylase domain-containing protein n=1 Tax=Lacibacter sp. MH-610 TaxID=3020883 RepID=UPI003892B0C1
MNQGSTILYQKKILITAGPTREAIDPVRYISNHSSGKMGYALAQEFLSRGAQVVLVTGPVCIELHHEHLKIIRVQSANEMYIDCCRYFEETDVAVFAAAVADYRPEAAALQKIKKNDESFMIKMVKNVDIAFEFGQIKQPHQVSVGFALETNDEEKHALSKLKKKNFDIVVLNSMNDAQAGFGFDTNKISIIQDDLSVTEFPLKSKKEVAVDIVDAAAKRLLKKQQLLTR